MQNYTREAILRMAEEEDVEFIRLQFTDMFGTLKNIAIPSSKLEKAMDNRCVIDASSIGGFIRNEEADMYLHPDLSTFTILPCGRSREKLPVSYVIFIRKTVHPIKKARVSFSAALRPKLQIWAIL